MHQYSSFWGAAPTRPLVGALPPVPRLGVGAQPLGPLRPLARSSGSATVVNPRQNRHFVDRRASAKFFEVQSLVPE